MKTTKHCRRCGSVILGNYALIVPGGEMIQHCGANPIDLCGACLDSLMSWLRSGFAFRSRARGLPSPAITCGRGNQGARNQLQEAL
jgi:hypothetical protein